MYNSVSSRKGGRVVECTGLENQRWVTPIRGFESHPFRHNAVSCPVPEFPLLDYKTRGAGVSTPSPSSSSLYRFGHSCQ